MHSGLLQDLGANFWYGHLGESVFDRYSAFHVLGATWLSIALGFFLRKQWDVFTGLVIAIFAWEIFESVVIANLGVERVGGGETLRNRFLGDTLCDLTGFCTYLAAAMSMRRWFHRQETHPAAVVKTPKKTSPPLRAPLSTHKWRGAGWTSKVVPSAH